MENVNFIADVIIRIVTYLGGGAVVVIGLSTYLGKIWANRFLEQDRQKYNIELEKIKTSYQNDLEFSKSQLEKVKSKYIRYSEFQFKLYNDLWGTLCKLKFTADDLWEDANIDNLISFVLHLDKTFSSIEQHRLLIEPDHYKKLQSILSTMAKFRAGKQQLIRFKKLTEEEKKLTDQNIINNIVTENRTTKDKYIKLLEVIAIDFQEQIRAS